MLGGLKTIKVNFSWFHSLPAQLSPTGEFQPVYDEFASIFLLVLAFVYRYQFSNTEMGISKDSFVAKYIVQGHQSFLADELDAEQTKYLGSWLKGLYDPVGITEEVTGACRPQQFYLIVPTIFSQTMLACADGQLDMDIVRNGLECRLPTIYSYFNTC